MSDELNTASGWVAELRSGNVQASQHITDHYHKPLVRLADRKMRVWNATLSLGDAEDITNSAWGSFFDAASKGKFPALKSSAELWRLLRTIVVRKVVKQQRWHYSKDRFKERTESRIACEEGNESFQLDQIAGEGLPPDIQLVLRERFKQMLIRLDDKMLRDVAKLRFAGYSNREIAEKQNCSVRTVESRLQRIRTIWGEP